MAVQPSETDQPGAGGSTPFTLGVLMLDSRFPRPVGDVGNPATWPFPVRYEVVRGIADSTPFALPEAGAMLHVRRLTPGERTAVPAAPYVYVHVTRGTVRLDGERLEPGDAARLTDEKDAEAVAEGAAEVLMWEMTGF